MSDFHKQQFSHLWNDLPIEERKRLMPHAMESQILHLEQSKLHVIRAHKKCMADFNDQIKNIKDDLKKYKMKGDGDE